MEAEKITKKQKIYSYKDAYESTLQYFDGDDLAAKVWVSKYALKDSDGNIYERTPDDMHHRIASEISRIEAKYPNPLSEQEIFSLIKDFKYIIPQGSPMTGIGNDFQIASLSNCFVIGSGTDSDS
ncbi:ribonucleotide reductase N-terminal alpha domain-containing protein, partial [Kaistella sp.]|uniref:ribonucleotide reductase N-terminal alpha domain-containing protein n=1 Tax=Kaistella sp. TaxID=2782235 RepID=UPI002F928D0C